SSTPTGPAAAARPLRGLTQFDSALSWLACASEPSIPGPGKFAECRCGVSEITIHSLRSNWPGARREGGSVSAAIHDRLSNEAPGPFQRNPQGGMSFGRRRCCSLLTDPLLAKHTPAERAGVRGTECSS